MTSQFRFFCPDPECGKPLGFSTRFIAKCVVEEEFSGNNANALEKDRVAFLERSKNEELFAKFQITLDPVLGLHFPLWCSKCQDIKYVHVSLGEMYNLSLVDIGRS